MYASLYCFLFISCIIVFVGVVMPIMSYSTPSPNYIVTPTNSLLDPLVLLQVTDTHISENDPINAINFSSFLSMVPHFNPDAVIHSGDIVDADSGSQSTTEWSSYSSTLLDHDLFTTSFMESLGNHDLWGTSFSSSPWHNHSVAASLRPDDPLVFSKDVIKGAYTSRIVVSSPSEFGWSRGVNFFTFISKQVASKIKETITKKSNQNEIDLIDNVILVQHWPASFVFSFTDLKSVFSLVDVYLSGHFHQDLIAYHNLGHSDGQVFNDYMLEMSCPDLKESNQFRLITIDGMVINQKVLKNSEEIFPVVQVLNLPDPLFVGKIKKLEFQQLQEVRILIFDPSFDPDDVTIEGLIDDTFMLHDFVQSSHNPNLFTFPFDVRQLTEDTHTIKIRVTVKDRQRVVNQKFSFAETSTKSLSFFENTLILPLELIFLTGYLAIGIWFLMLLIGEWKLFLPGRKRFMTDNQDLQRLITEPIFHSGATIPFSSKKFSFKLPKLVVYSVIFIVSFVCGISIFFYNTFGDQYAPLFAFGTYSNGRFLFEFTGIIFSGACVLSFASLFNIEGVVARLDASKEFFYLRKDLGVFSNVLLVFLCVLGLSIQWYYYFKSLNNFALFFGWFGYCTLYFVFLLCKWIVIYRKKCL
ncbi:hypothetical protein P9112_012557 [Eukaryota sp. TZLM1-RC]